MINSPILYGNTENDVVATLVGFQIPLPPTDADTLHVPAETKLILVDSILHTAGVLE
jgi:hypothetical protein